MSFTAFPFDPRVAAGVTACGYETPTPIQAQAIPPALEGRDVLGLAQTGTGKTAAYALPILNRLVGGPRGALRTLVLAPTRELAEQIRGSFQELGGRTGVRSTAIYGGIGMGRQIDALRRGTDIVVACPGRLLDHIRQRTIDLRRLEVLVLDEADMMLDMGFLPDVRRILEHVPTRRQSLLFSATMPAEIRSLAGELLRDPVSLKIRHSAPAETVSHALYPVAQHLKTALLLEILSRTETGSVLVFTRTKHRAKRLGEQLAREGHRAASLQGNLSQAARQAALNGFREGRYRILVATDIAARGIDVSRVSHVINFDIPDTTDAYTHRIGRTGRAERSGDAFTLVTGEDASLVRDIERVLGSAIERRHLEGFDYKQGSAAVKPAPAARPAKPATVPRKTPAHAVDRVRAARTAPAHHAERTTRPARTPKPAHGHPAPSHPAPHAPHAKPAPRPHRDTTSARPQFPRTSQRNAPPKRGSAPPQRNAGPPSKARGQQRPNDFQSVRSVRSAQPQGQPRHRADDRRAPQGAPRGRQQDSRTTDTRRPRAPRGQQAATRQPYQAYAPDAVQGFKGKVYSARDPYVTFREDSVWPWRENSRKKADRNRKTDDKKD